jgi:hypothetical protein
MADVTKNTAKRRVMAAGGKIVIDDGTDDITIDLVNFGSVRMTPPFVERVNYMNGVTPQRPLAGNKTTGVVEFTAIAGALTEAKGLIALATAVDAASGAAKVYATVEVFIPDYEGATTGQKVTMTNAWFENAPTYAGGAPDTIEGLQIRCQYADWATATY